MSLSMIVAWGIVAAIAVVAFLHARRKDKDLAETELLRAGLRARAEEYRKHAAASAFKDQYFTLAAADTKQTNDEIEDYQRKAIIAEQEGHALMLVAVTLDAIVKQPTKAKMIAAMGPRVRRHLSDNGTQQNFGRDQAARPQNTRLEG
jgi:hypothetical protein